MQQVARLFSDPLLPVDFCVQPIRFVAEQCGKTISSIQAIFFNALFLIQNHDLIPREGEIKVITLPQLLEFRLEPYEGSHQFQNRGVSQYSIFQHDLFEFETRVGDRSSFTLIRRRHPSFINFTYAQQFLDDVTLLISSIAQAILLAPVAIPLAAFGAIVRGARLCFGPSLYKRELEVCKANSNVYPDIGRIARAWQLKACKRGMATQSNPFSEPSTCEAAVFNDARTICKLIGQCMEAPDETCWIFHKVRICLDVALHAIQGIMLEGEEDLQTVSGQNLGHHLKIAHLATNPDNIRAAINSEVFSRVEGSGTALVSALAQKCLRRHAAGIYLESVESAVPFYEKLGFVQLDRHEIRMLEGGAIPMQLTAEKIERLFHNGTLRRPSKGTLVIPPEIPPREHNHTFRNYYDTTELSGGGLAATLSKSTRPLFPCCC